jgi:flagellar basal body P-ring protein FlgI
MFRLIREISEMIRFDRGIRAPNEIDNTSSIVRSESEMKTVLVLCTIFALSLAMSNSNFDIMEHTGKIVGGTKIKIEDVPYQISWW